MDTRYQDVESDQVPEILLDDGAKVRIISGGFNGVKGPVGDIVIDPDYLDITNSVRIDLYTSYQERSHRLCLCDRGRRIFRSGAGPICPWG